MVRTEDELKDRLTDLMLLMFTASRYSYDSFERDGDIIDKAHMLVAETEQKIIDCADYLTGTEIRTMEAMREAGAFFACTGDVVLKAFSDPEA